MDTPNLSKAVRACKEADIFVTEDEDSDDVQVFIKQDGFEYRSDPVSESKANASVDVLESLLEDHAFSREMIEGLMQEHD
jgi:hypothetical protein